MLVFAYFISGTKGQTGRGDKGQSEALWDIPDRDCGLGWAGFNQGPTHQGSHYHWSESPAAVGSFWREINEYLNKAITITFRVNT